MPTGRKRGTICHAESAQRVKARCVQRREQLPSLSGAQVSRVFQGTRERSESKPGMARANHRVATEPVMATLTGKPHVFERQSGFHFSLFVTASRIACTAAFASLATIMGTRFRSSRYLPPYISATPPLPAIATMVLFVM